MSPSGMAHSDVALVVWHLMVVHSGLAQGGISSSGICGVSSGGTVT